ncbi:hypothetical protein UA08_09483 [Talaromyces atroroseus]|uniref:Nudix hydrolase domain-containing protein n=1 Tax=Talaromyces atroroseus TaxID=1441469 RepID=A0A1Q5Q638_TALAT|nr:hypothetical protein UA08_09483 [Talaromyces atroroseus]OKL55254.1 hypothetical protein UA08_09483 [Talaromyces atroroseus]
MATSSYKVAPEIQQENLPSLDITQCLVAGGFIFNKQGEMLLLRRAPSDSFGGFWDYPGGSIEKTDARLLDGLSREVAEETGLIITEVFEGTDSVKLSPEHDAFHWITWEEFQQSMDAIDEGGSAKYTFKKGEESEVKKAWKKYQLSNDRVSS